MTDRIDTAIKLAREDGEAIKRILRPAAILGVWSGVVVDGSMYSPSWRALEGGARVWDMLSDSEPNPRTSDESADVQMAYEETLDRITDELGLYWEDGCLWRDAEELDATAAKEDRRNAGLQ